MTDKNALLAYTLARTVRANENGAAAGAHVEPLRGRREREAGPTDVGSTVFFTNCASVVDVGRALPPRQ